MPSETLGAARAIHVCRTSGRSGIADYARDFHRLVLEPLGYVLADPEDVLRQIDSIGRGVRFHIQLGVFQYPERLLMTELMRRGYPDIDATVHDPPFVTFPFRQFESRLLMRLSRGVDWYLGSFGAQRRALERLARVFVLSEAGRTALLKLAPNARVTAIPHLVRPDRIWPENAPLGDALLYFGFIGPSKGLDYALELHRALLRLRPGTHLHIVGQAGGAAAERYLGRLKDAYREETTFHGYVPDEALDDLLAKAAHVVLPYRPNKYIVPASGSALQAIRRGRVLWSTDVNAISELVRDGENGFLLSLDVATDAARIAALLDDPVRTRAISDAARGTALAIAAYPFYKHFDT
jgi:glycosyltransferase involved in cell wall biosynthesis